MYLMRIFRLTRVSVHDALNDAYQPYGRQYKIMVFTLPLRTTKEGQSNIKKQLGVKEQI